MIHGLEATQASRGLHLVAYKRCHGCRAGEGAGSVTLGALLSFALRLRFAVGWVLKPNGLKVVSAGWSFGTVNSGVTGLVCKASNQ